MTIMPPTALSSSTVSSSPAKPLPAPCSSLVGPLRQLQSIPQPARRKDLAFLGFLCALHGAVPREVRTYGFGGMALEAVVLSQPQQQGSTIAWGVAPWQRALEWPLLGSGGGGGIEWRMLIRLIVDAAA